MVKEWAKLTLNPVGGRTWMDGGGNWNLGTNGKLCNLEPRVRKAHAKSMKSQGMWHALWLRERKTEDPVAGCSGKTVVEKLWRMEPAAVGDAMMSCPDDGYWDSPFDADCCNQCWLGERRGMGKEVLLVRGDGRGGPAGITDGNVV